MKSTGNPENAFAIPLSRPDIQPADRRAVQSVLNSDWLSRGPAQSRFEQALAQALAALCSKEQAGGPDSRTVVAVSSGTSALTLILKALDIGGGDQVITSPFTVPATLNAIAQTGAEPVLADIDGANLALDPDSVAPRINARTRAVIAVHPFGLPAPVGALARLCDNHGISLIEDSCEALGTRIAGRALGTFGRAAAFGFYPNKQITTGEGGAVVCSDAVLASRVRRLANHGREGTDWLDQREVGINARMSDIACALGASQLARLQEIIAMREERVGLYREQLRDLPGVHGPPAVERDVMVSWFALPVLVAGEGATPTRDEVVAAMAESGIQCGRYFAPMHRQPAWRDRYRDESFPVCEDIAARSLILPLFNGLGLREISRVCDRLRAIMAAA